MAQFYAEIRGNGGRATRCGGKSSGIWGHIRGWTSGVRVEGGHDDDSGEDCFTVYVTSGSSGGRPDRRIAEIRGGKVTLTEPS